MSSKGLTKEIIVAEAVRFIEESGASTVSLHELARRLKIKTPSLYNHIKNTKELQYEIFRYAIDKFVANQNAATAGKEKDAAVMAFAEAYHTFATDNKGLYRLIMSMPQDNDDTKKEMATPLLHTAVKLLSDYGLSAETTAHWQRVFRSILHGFVSQEDLGYFYYYKDTDLKKSRELAVQCFLSGLHAELEKYRTEEKKDEEEQ